MGISCALLVHELGRKCPRITKELLDITIQYASGKETIGAVFDRNKGKVERDDDDEGKTTDHPTKKNNKQRQGDSEVLAVVADRKMLQGAVVCR